MKDYTAKRFQVKKTASAYAANFKQEYGYKPTVFKVTTPHGDVHYAVVKPRGLKKIR